MSVRISSCVTFICYSAYAHLQNRMIGRIIDALRAVAFSRAGGTNVLLVCSLTFARHAIGKVAVHRVRL